MRHATCRRALLDGALDPEVATHLEECDRCRAFSRDLALVSELAPGLAPPPAPAGLADRAVGAVRTGRVGAAAGAPSAVHSAGRVGAGAPASLRRRPALVTMAVAATLILLVGVLAALPSRDGGSGLDPLLVAAERTVDQGTARLRLDGTVSLRVRLPEVPDLPEVDLPDVPELPPFPVPTPPDLSQVPEGFRAQFEAGFESSVAQARERYERYAAEARAEMERLRADARAGFSALDVPREFSVRLHLGGSGAVVFPDRMHVEGEIDVAASEPAVPDAPGGFEVTVVKGRTYHRAPGGPWVRVPEGTGPIGTTVLDPAAVSEYLTGARPGVEDRGEERLGDETVRRYRFRVARSAFDAPGVRVSTTADAWIGADDDLLRRLTARSEAQFEGPAGFDVRLESELTLRLTDFGADVRVVEPEAVASASSPFGPSAALYPFETGFGVSFHYELALPQPPPLVEVPELPDFPPVPVPEVPTIPALPELPRMPVPPSFEGGSPGA